MILVVQRVLSAEVQVGPDVVGKIGKGALILLGIEKGDSLTECGLLLKKLLSLRFFSGRSPMDLSIGQCQASCLVVSQFTLLGNLSKGCRPSFDRAAPPEQARALYEAFIAGLRAEKVTTETGSFGADMVVRLQNDGPVTFILESKDGKLFNR